MHTFIKTVVHVLMITIIFMSLSTRVFAAAQSPEAEALAFYKGKVIDFIVPYDTGGGYDMMARLVAPFLQKYLGSTLVVDNIPGAGSMVGTNKIYAAKKDGLTIGIVNTSGLISAIVTKNKAARFDINQFNWLGRVDADPNMLVMGPNTGYKTFEDIVKSTKTIKLASTGAGTSQNSCEKILTQAAKLNTQIVTGYSGSNDCNMAVVRGEVDGAMPPVSSSYSLINGTKAVPIVVISLKRVPEFPNIPIAGEVTKGEGKRLVEAMAALLDTGRSVVMTPGIPPNRLAALRQALDKSLHDPALIDQSTKAKRPISPLSADQLKELVSKSLNVPDDVKKNL